MVRVQMHNELGCICCTDASMKGILGRFVWRGEAIVREDQREVHGSMSS